MIALLVAATLCVGLAQRGQRRGQEGRGENAQGGQAAQQGTQEGEDFQEEGQEGPRGQGNSDHVRWLTKLTWIAQWWNIKNMFSPYILYGPHGYNTFTHSRCQEVNLPIILSWWRMINMIMMETILTITTTKVRIPSELEVVPRCKLLTLPPILTLLKQLLSKRLLFLHNHSWWHDLAI